MKQRIPIIFFVVLTMVTMVGCSSTPKPPPLPDGQHRVPVNATLTAPGSTGAGGPVVFGSQS